MNLNFFVCGGGAASEVRTTQTYQFPASLGNETQYVEALLVFLNIFLLPRSSRKWGWGGTLGAAVRMGDEKRDRFFFFYTD